MLQYRIIDYPKMLYETLRNYFSINANGDLSILYRILLSCLWPLKLQWDSFVTFRNEKLIIANTKWQVGQLENVLNFFFDSELKRIKIQQSTITTLSVPTINYESIVCAPTIDYDSTICVPTINNTSLSISLVIFLLPNEIYINEAIKYQIKMVIEQIKIDGIKYEIQSL